MAAVARLGLPERRCSGGRSASGACGGHTTDGARPSREDAVRTRRRVGGWAGGVPAFALGAALLAAGLGLRSLDVPRARLLPGARLVPGGQAYVVRAGDTLWSIAEAAEPGGDPRVLVARLEQEVRGGPLVPGERLVVPVRP